MRQNRILFTLLGSIIIIFIFSGEVDAKCPLKIFAPADWKQSHALTLLAEKGYEPSLTKVGTMDNFVTIFNTVKLPVGLDQLGENEFGLVESEKPLGTFGALVLVRRINAELQLISFFTAAAFSPISIGVTETLRQKLVAELPECPK